MSKLLRINEDTLTLLEQLEQEMGTSKQSILQIILDQYMRNRILSSINAAYATLRQDPEQWKEELEERALWETTTHDGLDDL